MQYRLNQYLAKVLGISRRQADNLILENKVILNQEIAVIGNRVDDAVDVVEVLEKDQRRALNTPSSEPNVVLFYKPIFCMTTRSDPEGRKTLYDFLPMEFQNLKTAGRLDFMSEGVLVLSDDGNLIQSLSHPKFESSKKYLVGLTEELSPRNIKAAASGELIIEDYQLNPVKIQKLSHHQIQDFEYLRLNERLFYYFFELTEGRNNQIRKMVDIFNNKVGRLVRVSQGEYSLTKELFERRYIKIGSNLSELKQQPKTMKEIIEARSMFKTC